MVNWRLLYIKFLSSVIAGLWSSLAIAEGSKFHLNNLQIFLDGRNKSTLLRVTNMGRNPIEFKAKVYRWEQSLGGRDELIEEDQNVVVFPLLFSVDPEKEFNLRIGARQTLGSEEKTYRLILEELPSVTIREGNVVTILTTLSLPIFIQPSIVNKKVEFSDFKFNEKKISFRLFNVGNVHIPPSTIFIKGLNEDEGTVFETSVNSYYILARKDKSFEEIEIKKCQGVKKIRLEMDYRYSNEIETITSEIKVPDYFCRG